MISLCLSFGGGWWTSLERWIAARPLLLCGVSVDLLEHYQSQWGYSLVRANSKCKLNMFFDHLAHIYIYVVW